MIHSYFLSQPRLPKNPPPRFSTGEILLPPGSRGAASGGSLSQGGGFIYTQTADPNLVISGHLEVDSLYASNDMAARQAPITVNVCNAPNNSTVQCGCENINCPFCNLMLSIEKTDPTVLQ